MSPGAYPAYGSSWIYSFGGVGLWKEKRPGPPQWRGEDPVYSIHCLCPLPAQCCLSPPAPPATLANSTMIAWISHDRPFKPFGTQFHSRSYYDCCSKSQSIISGCFIITVGMGNILTSRYALTFAGIGTCCWRGPVSVLAEQWIKSWVVSYPNLFGKHEGIRLASTSEVSKV